MASTTSQGASVRSNPFTLVTNSMNSTADSLTYSIFNTMHPRVNYDSSITTTEDITSTLKTDETDPFLFQEQNEEPEGQNQHQEFASDRNLESVQFYHKLQELKEENRKTIQAYDQLYKSRIWLESANTNSVEDISNNKNNDYYGNNRTFGSGQDDLVIEGIGKRKTNKRDGAVVSKPPTGKMRDVSSNLPVQSKKLPHKSQSAVTLKFQRPSSAPTMPRSHSLGNDHWETVFSQSTHSMENFVIPVENNAGKYEKALARVDKLWEDFKINELAQRRHSFSSTADSRKSQSENKKKEWRHRITIPQPFHMSIREALKERKKSKAQTELDQMRLAKQKQEEAECEKKFKAQPVPAHVYLPKYEEIMEKNETRRNFVKQVCQELLQSQVKPFKFETREKDKKQQRSHSAPIKKAERTAAFKAKPVPKYIFSSEINQKLLEEEELRKIRVKMRSKELLRESSLPPNMAAREKLKEQERKEKLKASRSSTKKRKPKNVHDIPDYNALYNQFKQELERRRSMHKGTVVEPFNLETERINSNIEKIKKEIKNDDNIKENRWPFMNSRLTPRSSTKYLDVVSNSLDYIPCQTTKSVELKATMLQKERDRIEKRQKEEEEAERRQKARETKLRQYLSDRTGISEIPKPKDSVADRLKKRRQEDRERQEAYEKEIEEMKARVQQSPLLVEQYLAEYAKNKANKKFATTLFNAGLDEKEFVSLKTSKSASVREENDNADDSAEVYPQLSAKNHSTTPSQPSYDDDPSQSQLTRRSTEEDKDSDRDDDNLDEKGNHSDD